MHFRKLLRATKAICIRQLAVGSWQRRQQMRHHQGSNTNAPVTPFPPQSPTPLLLLVPFRLQTRIMATDALQLAGRHVTWSILESPCDSPSHSSPPPFACCTPNVEIYVYLYLCSTRPVQKVAESGEYLCYGQCLFYLSYMSRLVFPLPPLSSYTSFRFDGHTAAFTAFLFLIFFYFLQFN